MKQNVEEKSLLAALEFCSLRDLPPKWDKENIYLMALALVSKKDGTRSYVSMKKDENGNDVFVKDFGTISTIHEVLEVYPFLYLDAKYVPTFKTRTKDERIEWLCKTLFIEDDGLKELSLKELDKKVLATSMQIALKMINNK
jgi:hypothetical protein